MSLSFAHQWKSEPKPLSLTPHSPPQLIGEIKRGTTLQLQLNSHILAAFSPLTPTWRWVIKCKWQQSVPEVASCPPGPQRAGGWDERRWQRAVNAFTFKYHPCPPVYPRVSSQPLMIICPHRHKSPTQHTGLSLPKRGPSTKTAGRLQVKNPNKLAEQFVRSACLPGPCQDPDFVSASHPIHHGRAGLEQGKMGTGRQNWE